MNKRQRASLLMGFMLVAFLVAAWCYFQWGAGNTLRIFDTSSNELQLGSNTKQKESRVSVNKPENSSALDDVNSVKVYPETAEQIFDKYISVENEPALANEKGIEDKYLPRFSLLQEIYEQKLNKLLADAAREYTANQPSNPKISRIKLVGKYYNRGRELEADCDMCFERLLGEMEMEFRKAQLSSDSPRKIRGDYEEIKKERRKELLRMMAEEND